MPYHRYETDAFVLASVPVRERDRLYSLLTRDFGLVKALAAGALMPHSRLAPHLSKTGKVKVSLVKGKGSWRIVGTRDGLSGWSELSSQSEHRRAFVRVLRFLRTALYEEDRHPEIFDLLDAYLRELRRADHERVITLEIAVVSRLLTELGHLDLPKDLARVTPFADESLAAAAPGGDLAARVNSAMRQAFS